MKILFNEIAPKMHIFRAMRIGGYMLLQHCSSRWGVIKFLIIKWGVTKNIAKVLHDFWKFMPPLFQRKWWPPNSSNWNNYFYPAKLQPLFLFTDFSTYKKHGLQRSTTDDCSLRMHSNVYHLHLMTVD